MDDKDHKCIFVGYSERSKGYKLFNPLTKKNVIIRDVKFDESDIFEGEESGQTMIFQGDYTSNEICGNSSSPNCGSLLPPSSFSSSRREESNEEPPRTRMK